MPRKTFKAGKRIEYIPPEIIEENIELRRPWGRVKANKRTLDEMKNILKHTWDKELAKVDKGRRYTDLQIAFCRAYVKNGRRSKADAIMKAGFQFRSPGRAHSEALKILNKPGIENLLSALEAEEKAKMAISIEEVVEWFQNIAKEAMGSGDFTNANRAMENLGKYLQMFVDKREITHKVVHNTAELDARIKELNAVLEEARPNIMGSIKLD